MFNQRVMKRSREGLVTVTSVTVCVWMDQGCHSNYVIHGYSDKGVGSVCMAICGWTRDVTVTMSSRDTLKRG